MTSENLSLLRTVHSYEQDCKSNSSFDTGIIEKCVFHEVDNFHVCLNLCVDYMHNVFEGMFDYTFIPILYDLIYKKKNFTLKILNGKIKSFQYSIADSNKITIIKREHILTKKKLKMSASESILFARYFGVYVGDYVDEGDKVWKLYILFSKITSFLSSPRYVVGHLIEFERFSEEFLSLYIELYGDLKFKFHIFSHYLRVLKENGPLTVFWTMRFESFHRLAKSTSISSCNKINVIKTISIKSQLRLAHMQITKLFCPYSIVCENKEVCDQFLKIKYFKDSDLIFKTNKITFNDVKYAKGMIVVAEIGENGLLNFGEIDVFFLKENEVFAVLKLIKSLYFDDHYNAYNVYKDEKTVFISLNELPNIQPCTLIEKKSVFHYY